MSSVHASSSTANEQTDSRVNDAETNSINVDASEVDKFNKLAGEWWSSTGAFATLHEINPLASTG